MSCKVANNVCVETHKMSFNDVHKFSNKEVARFLWNFTNLTVKQRVEMIEEHIKTHGYFKIGGIINYFRNENGFIQYDLFSDKLHKGSGDGAWVPKSRSEEVWQRTHTFLNGDKTKIPKVLETQFIDFSKEPNRSDLYSEDAWFAFDVFNCNAKINWEEYGYPFYNVFDFNSKDYFLKVTNYDSTIINNTELYPNQNLINYYDLFFKNKSFSLNVKGRRYFGLCKINFENLNAQVGDYDRLLDMCTVLNDKTILERLNLQNQYLYPLVFVTEKGRLFVTDFNGNNILFRKDLFERKYKKITVVTEEYYGDKKISSKQTVEIIDNSQKLKGKISKFFLRNNSKFLLVTDNDSYVFEYNIMKGELEKL